ncbi:nickel pincer cofactor biosynthesis protein LarC [Desulfoplanes sp.]
MNILYYDCFAGISGDMHLAAMIDLGVGPDYLRTELNKLGISDEFKLAVTREERNGIMGTRVDVCLRPANGSHGHHHDHGSHDHQDRPAHHDYGHGPDQPHAPPHRTFADIRGIIMASTLSDPVKETSLAIFSRVAEAEAKVHGKPVDRVHFHEVGATDSIVDIVGAAICLEYLGVDAVWASPVELGGGQVRCAHGIIPVPAPATVAILEGIPTTRGGTDHEATTPTGAAILAARVDRFITTPALTVTKSGYGIGHRRAELPNLLRIHLARVEPACGDGTASARLLQCNIDDMTGEQLGHVLDLLMEKGAMDVHFTPIIMKKNRPATQISLLCGEAEASRFKEMLFCNTTTLGIKSIAVEKTSLERRFRKIETPYGPVHIKEALLNGEVVHAKPEYEECREIARRTGIPLTKIYTLVARQE